MNKRLLEWRVGFCSGIAETPEEFVPARVPGAVQLDWANAHGWPEYTYGDNWKAYGWMEDVYEDVYWVYRTRLDTFTLVAVSRQVSAPSLCPKPARRH